MTKEEAKAILQKEEERLEKRKAYGERRRLFQQELLKQAKTLLAPQVQSAARPS